MRVIYGTLERYPSLECKVVEIRPARRWWRFDWKGALLLLGVCLGGAASITLLFFAMFLAMRAM